MKYAFVAAFFAVLGFTFGIALDDSNPCDAHEVYVVDSDRCVLETDHGAHEGGH